MRDRAPRERFALSFTLSAVLFGIRGGVGEGNKDFGTKYNILIRLRGNIFSSLYIFINIVLVRMVTIIAFSVKEGK